MDFSWIFHRKSLASANRPKPIRSIRHQLTVVFIGLMFLSILSITGINRLFLESYYITRKTDVLLGAKQQLHDLEFDKIISYYGDDETEQDEEGIDYPSNIEKGSSRQNLSWVLMDPDNSSSICWPSSNKALRSKIFGYAYGIDEDREKSRVLQSGKDCVVQLVYDRFSDMAYLECWGQFDNGYYFLIRTPLESIRESVSISNTFYFFVGIAIIIISGMVISGVSRSITRPISELTVQSQKMARLDFDARYVSRAGNEIDVLGRNFNHMSARLEQTISELKTANNELKKDIADKIEINEKRKEFLDNVSHELKTPIALIQGYAEGLKMGINDDPESTEFYCDVIIDEAARMNTLVQSLLALSRLESGRDVPVMERVDLTQLVRGVMGTMTLMTEQAGATIRFETETPVYVWTDEFKTEQVVTNYLSNAVHHVNEGGRIEIRFQEEGPRIRVGVFNSGGSIPEEELDKVWTKFYKVDKSHSRDYGGTGIGLSIVKAIMESMHQEYGVKNCEDGVEFWFTLERQSA